MHKCRARYISNALLGETNGDDDDDAAAGAPTGGNGWGGQHDLVRHKMQSVMDDPWIEDIRAQDFLVRKGVVNDDASETEPHHLTQSSIINAVTDEAGHGPPALRLPAAPHRGAAGRARPPAARGSVRRVLSCLVVVGKGRRGHRRTYTHTNTYAYTYAYTHRQFYLFPNLLLCSFGIDSAAETHMLHCPQVRKDDETERRGPERAALMLSETNPHLTSTLEHPHDFRTLTPSASARRATWYVGD